jgi:hypothetical protein
MNDSENHRPMDIVEDALRTYPLAPVPAALKTRVMTQVRLHAIVPRFAFPWLGTAISLMASTLLTAVAALVLGIPSSTVMRLEQSVRIFLLQPGSRSILLAAAIWVIPAILCLGLAMRLFRSPLRRHGWAHR